MSPLSPDHIQAYAALHAQCFEGAERWRAETFRGFLNDEAVFSEGDENGFILCRQMADEAEILTICVAPALRRQGIARQLVSRMLAEARRRSLKVMHLEVAEDNAPALITYKKAGFIRVGRRPDYYRRGQKAIAAWLLRIDIVDRSSVP